MHTSDLILEIKKLPLSKKIYVIEETIKAIRKEEISHQMEMAASDLEIVYNTDKELTAFTSLDMDHFYEAK